MTELLTSLDVVNQSFKKSIRGYDSAEVDDFLDRIAEILQVYAQKTKDMERDLAVKAESLAEYEKMKGVLHEALLMAQNSADAKVKRAEAEAEKIVAEAMEKADYLCSEAAQEAERLSEGVAQIRNIRRLYEQEFRGILAKFDNMLNQAMSGSAVKAAVESILGPENTEPTSLVAETEAAAESFSECSEESQADRQDLKDAFNVLGVDPNLILGGQEPERDN